MHNGRDFLGYLLIGLIIVGILVVVASGDDTETVLDENGHAIYVYDNGQEYVIENGHEIYVNATN